MSLCLFIILNVCKYVQNKRWKKYTSHQTFIIQRNTIKTSLFILHKVSIHSSGFIQLCLNPTLQFPWGDIFTLKNMKPKKTIIIIVNIIIDWNFALFSIILFFSRYIFTPSRCLSMHHTLCLIILKCADEQYEGSFDVYQSHNRP